MVQAFALFAQGESFPTLQVALYVCNVVLVPTRQQWAKHRVFYAARAAFRQILHLQYAHTVQREDFQIVLGSRLAYLASEGHILPPKIKHHVYFAIKDSMQAGMNVSTAHYALKETTIQESAW
jgi:hypothetical protein